MADSKASHAGFVHLHNHSEYSLLDGMIRLSDKTGKKPSETLKLLAQEGAKGVALTDHGNMFGVIEFYSRCKDAGLSPIVGCELYFAKGSRREKSGSQKETCHLTVLARDYTGYQNLMELATQGYAEGYYYDPRIDRELLAKHAKGLIVLSGCLKSEVCQLIAAGDIAGAEKAAVALRDMLEPGSLYLEIMDHGIAAQQQATKALLEIHRRTGIPLVATNDCHYARADEAEAQDARVAIATGSKLADKARLKFESRDFYLKTADQMSRLFSFAPEAVSNTLAIAERCRLEIPMGRMLLPEFAVPEGRTQDSYLAQLCLKGLSERLGDIPPSYKERLDFELSVIRKMGFAGYFLIVWDFIAYARREGIPVGPGRGSGAGALVAYSLRITDIDPLRHRLLFERFLNPDRKAMPDLDIDLSDTGRERVIEYVRGKYGSANVAQIITFGAMAARLVVRDVGRVLGVPLAAVDRLAKLIPATPGAELSKAIQDNPEIKEAARDPQIKKLLELSLKLEGLKRHSSTHAAGTVITKEPVARYAPLSRTSRSETMTTQYDGESLGTLGLLKVDFLGLRTLRIIDDAVRLVNRRLGHPFDIAAIPSDDPKTFELLRQGHALAVFQLDSSGIRDLLTRLKPTDFGDIVAVIALYRPGPMKAGMLDDFVERKHGRKRVAYLHKLLEPILKDTFGCFVYQEQVMETAKSLAGFTPGQADGLRKAMSKKIPAELEKLRAAFVAGSVKNGIAEKLANKVYDQLTEFGGYGFNRSHSAAYGLLAYQTAYLKANYPLEFMCAVLTSEIGHSSVSSEEKENKLATYLDEARRMGLKVLPPDVQRSEPAFSIEEPSAVRFGLSAVKNVGEGAARLIMEERLKGLFKDYADFQSRVDPRAINKKVAESLAKAGALDALWSSPPAAARASALKAIESSWGKSGKSLSDLDRGQELLFELPPPSSEPGSIETARPLEAKEILDWEKEVLGVYFSGHPLDGLEPHLRALRSHAISELSAQATANPVRVCGLIRQIKRMTTKDRGAPWARAVIEDATGEMPILVFPKAYAAGLGQKLKGGAIVAVSGRLSLRNAAEDSPPELIAEDLCEIDEAMSRFARKLRILLEGPAPDADAFARLKSLFESSPGSCAVILERELGPERLRLDLEEGVRLTPNLLKSVESLFGKNSWRIESAFSSPTTTPISSTSSNST